MVQQGEQDRRPPMGEAPVGERPSQGMTPGAGGAGRGDARVSPGPGGPAATRCLLALTLGDERFALDIGVVREVLDFGELTRIPLMPSHVRGVVNLRGAAVPVVDLRTRLGMGRVDRAVHARIVIVEMPLPTEAGGVQLVGALADAVREVIEVDAAAVDAPPRMGASVPGEMLAGIFRHDGRYVMLLDAGQLFADDAPEEDEAVPGARAGSRGVAVREGQTGAHAAPTHAPQTGQDAGDGQ